MIYRDIEDIIDDILDHLRTVAGRGEAPIGINDYITAINTQKAVIDEARGRTIMTLDPFENSDATSILAEGDNLFFFMIEEAPNADPAMLVSIPNWTTDDMGANAADVVFTILVEDPQDGTDPKRKLLRYIRALGESLEAFLNQADMINSAKLSRIEPDISQVYNDDTVKSFYSAGIRVSLFFA